MPGFAAMKTIGRRLHEAGAYAYLAPTLRREARSSPGAEINEGAAQYPFAIRSLADAGLRSVLDVGTGLSAWPRVLADCGFQVTAIDELARYWGPLRPFNRHYRVLRDDITAPRLDGHFDAITCLNVMMAIADDGAAVAGMFSLVRPGGLVVLSFPYCEQRSVPNAYALPDAGYGSGFRFPCRIYSRDDIERWQRDNEAAVVAQEYFEMFTGPHWAVGKRTTPHAVLASEPHHFTVLALRGPSA